MVMRVLLVGILLTLVPGEVMAKGAVWRTKHVTVNDYTPPDWKPYVEDMVVAFNAMLPKRAPKLVYRSMPEKSCPNLRIKRGRGDISICVGASVDFSVISMTDDVITRAVIKLGNAEPQHRFHLICHEMMHALTDVPDAYDNPHLETSCVHGTTNFPGAWDAAHTRWLYKKARHR